MVRIDGSLVYFDKKPLLFNHCVKSVRIQSFSGPYFPAFGLNMDQKNSEYRNILRSEYYRQNIILDGQQTLSLKYPKLCSIK